MDWIPTVFLTLAAALPSSSLPPDGEVVFRFPTANRALLEEGGGERFYVGTVGKPWMSGSFGCVRTEGWQMHEGLDIGPLTRDRRGEATDPVLATAAGEVAYVNRRAGLSNYGIYLVLRHRIEAIEIYSLYAHLARVREDLKPGVMVHAGEALGVMGRTAATRQGISRDRAHLHFELNLMVSDRFVEWHRKHGGGQRNDHGLFNGQNFLGIDPSLVLLSSHRFPTNFSLARFITVQRALCRVAIRQPECQWVRRHPVLVRAPEQPLQGAVAGYELHLDFNGLPVRAIPRTSAELPAGPRALLGVDEEVQRRSPCRRIVVRSGEGWALGRTGERLLDLLAF